MPLWCSRDTPPSAVDSEIASESAAPCQRCPCGSDVRPDRRGICHVEVVAATRAWTVPAEGARKIEFLSQQSTFKEHRCQQREAQSGRAI
jgi:hypothetical protein